jgi:hypothetical protein
VYLIIGHVSVRQLQSRVLCRALASFALSMMSAGAGQNHSVWRCLWVWQA